MEATSGISHLYKSNSIDYVYTQANKTFRVIDKAFNYGACVPIVGVAVSKARMAIYGNIQLISGLGIAAIGAVGFCISACAACSQATQKNWEKATMIGLEYTIQGALNIFRGVAETIVGIATFGFGNPLLIIPNWEKDFNPYFEYGHFQKI